MQRLRIPVHFSARFSLCSATGVRVKEQCRCHVTRLSSAHILIPHYRDHLHIKVADMYCLNGRALPLNSERDLIEAWLCGD